jgi:iron(III) transport system permease protein
MRRGIGGIWISVFVLTALALIAFAFAPLSLVLRDGLGAPLLRELGDPEARGAWLNTVVLSVAVTAAAVPIGALLAWLIERTDLLRDDRSRARWTALLALPLAVPPYLLAMSWALLGNGRNGLLNRISTNPWIDLYGLDGAIMVLASAAYPFALLSVRAALTRADPSLEEAARVSGARPHRVLLDVTLPLVMPAMTASAGLVFVFASAAFGVPYLLGSLAEPPVMFLTTRIYQYTNLGGKEMLARSAALAVLLLSTSVLAQAFASWVAKRRSTVQVGGKAARPSLVRLGAWRNPSRAVVAAFALIFIATPLGTIAFTSFSATFADPADLTLEHWRAVLARKETLRAFTHSILLAALAGAIVAVLGLVLARLAAIGGRTGRALASLAAAPYAVPGTVLAIGLIFAFAYEYRLIVLEQITFALYLPGTLAILLIAYAVKHLAFGVRGARAALEQIHPSLEEAARISGAGSVRSVVDVILPLVWPSVAAAFVLVALPCLSELTMSVLLFGAGTETSGTLLFELQSYASPPAASVIATLVVLVALGGDAIARRLQRS